MMGFFSAKKKIHFSSISMNFFSWKDFSFFFLLLLLQTFFDRNKETIVSWIMIQVVQIKSLAGNFSFDLDISLSLCVYVCFFILSRFFISSSCRLITNYLSINYTNTWPFIDLIIIIHIVCVCVFVCVYVCVFYTEMRSGFVYFFCCCCPTCSNSYWLIVCSINRSIDQLIMMIMCCEKKKIFFFANIILLYHEIIILLWYVDNDDDEQNFFFCSQIFPMDYKSKFHDFHRYIEMFGKHIHKPII